MPLTYRRDDRHARVVLTAEREVSVCDWADCLSEQMFDQAWHYATLYDFTAPGAKPPALTEFDHISHRVATLQQELGPRGPVAFAAPDPQVYADLRLWIDDLGVAGPYHIDVFTRLAD